MRLNLPIDTMQSTEEGVIGRLPTEAAPIRRLGHSPDNKETLSFNFKKQQQQPDTLSKRCVCLKCGPGLIEWFVTIVIVAARVCASSVALSLRQPSNISFFCQIDLPRWLCRNLYFCLLHLHSRSDTHRGTAFLLSSVGDLTAKWLLVTRWTDGTGCPSDAFIIVHHKLPLLIIANCKWPGEMHLQAASVRVSVGEAPHTLSGNTLTDTLFRTDQHFSTHCVLICTLCHLATTWCTLRSHRWPDSYLPKMLVLIAKFFFVEIDKTLCFCFILFSWLLPPSLDISVVTTFLCTKLIGCTILQLWF